MTYIELLNSFWDSTRFNPCSSNEATMYFYLLHQCNIRRWINPFEFKTREFEVMLGFTRATISAIRNKLKQRGLIDFGKGIGSGSAVYLICGAKITDKELAEKFCVQSANTKLNTTLNTTLNTNLNTTANPTLYIEERRNKTKDISPAGDIEPPPPSVGLSLFEEEEKKARKKKSQPRPKPPEQPPPTIEEVKSHFLSQRADERLQDWEREAEVFFNHFTSLGWRTSSGAKISHWDSRANLWIMDHEKPKQQENPVSDEVRKADKFSERRGSESGAKKRKGFKGTF